jgi:hypothetical protein
MWQSINSLVKETVVYWEPIGYDGFGKRTFRSPVEIKCIWQDSSTLFTDSKGAEIQSKAICYPLIDLIEEGFLYHGKITDISSITGYPDPMYISKALEIKRFDKTKSLVENIYVRKVYLTYYGGVK